MSETENGHGVSSHVVKPENEAEQSSSFTFSEKPSLEELRKLQETFSNERGWNKYHSPRNLLLALVGEVGELAEIFQWRGEVTEGLGDWSEADKDHLGEELSDVLIYLIRLADKCQVNLPAVALKKLDKNKQKYPVSRVFGSSRKYTEYVNDQGTGVENDCLDIWKNSHKAE